MDNIEYMVQDILIPCIMLLGLALLIIAALSYKRTKNNKILIIAIAFACFFVKGLILSAGLYVGMLSSDSLPPSFVIPFDFLLLLDFLILLLLYFAVFKR
jgi:Mg2+/citrate symporter